MFTGIIEELGTIIAIEHEALLSRLFIQAQKTLEGTQLGDSIAVNGTCLTVTTLNEVGFSAELMPETLRVTEFLHYQKGLKVNLERSLCVGDRLGGHMVSGHIDGGAMLVERKTLDKVSELTFMLDAPHKGLIIPKGSIAIEGVSLTIMAVDNGFEGDTFTVGIIPHTDHHTNLGALTIGDRVHIEFDIYGKYVKAQYGCE